MTTATSRFTPTLGLCLVLSIAAAEAVFAQDGDRAFKDGMEAYDKKEWAQVIKLMTAAIAADSQESPRRIEYGGRLGFGQKNTQYMPYYYLGEALYRLQPADCSGAIEAWGRAEAAGVVKKRAELDRTIQDGYIVCRERGILRASEYDPLRMQALKQYESVIQIAAGVSKLGTEYPDLFGSDVRERYQQGRNDLESAGRRLKAAATSRAVNDLEEARRATERASVTMRDLNDAIRSVLDARRSTDAAAREAQQALLAATQLRDQLDAAHGAAGGVALPSGMNASRQQANRTLERGNDQYASGTKTSNRAALIEAMDLGQEAASQYRALRGELDNLLATIKGYRLSEARTAAGQAAKFVDDLFATLDRRLAANPTLAAEVGSQHEELVKRGTADRGRLDAVVKGDDVAAITRATRRVLQLRDLLTELTGKFGPLTLRERGVSQALEDGTARFFAGQYQDALTQLNPAGGFAADDPLQLHVHLFRAASLYALYAQSRGTRAELRAQALAEIDACKKIDSFFRPDPRAFSPRFLAFYRDSSDAAAAVAAPSQPQ